MTKERKWAIAQEKVKVLNLVNALIALSVEVGHYEEYIAMGYVSMSGKLEETKERAADAKHELVEYIEEIIDN